LKTDGTVVGWGYNSYGQASPPAGLTDVVAISAGFEHSLALVDVDKAVVAWGRDDAGQGSVPGVLTDVVAISAGGYHNLVLKGDGTVVGWGYNPSGQTSPPAGLTGVVAIAAGGYHSLALKDDGTVVGWGFNSSGQATVPAWLTGVVAIAADHGHSLAVKADGTVVGWGYSSYGQATVPAGLADVMAISAGFEHSLALVDVNRDPLLSYDDDVVVDEGTTAENSGTVSDPDGDMVTMSASIGTVVFNIYEGTWEWSLDTSDGPIQPEWVTVSADDGKGGTVEVGFWLEVNNVAPTATFSDDGPVDEGTSFKLSLTDVFDPSGPDTTAGFACAFDCGSGYGTFGGASFAVCPTVDNGTRAVAGVIRDKDGAETEYTATVSVVNAAPMVAIDSVVDQVGAEIGVDVEVGVVGVPVDLTGSFTDAGVADTHTATIDWDDASIDNLGTVTGTTAGSHTYDTPGSYVISLAVTDNDLGVGAATFAIEVVEASEALETTVEDLAELGLGDAVDLLVGNNGGNGNNGAVDKLEQGNRNAALVKLKKVIDTLEDAEAADPGLDLTTLKGLIALSAKSVALDAIAEADAATSGPAADAVLQEASDRIDGGDDRVAVGDYTGAIDEYRKAVQLAEGLL
jgi:hypothetical protein